MGMIGSSAPGAMYDPSQMSGADRLMMAGAMLRDVSSSLGGGDAQNVMAVRNYLAQRQMMGGLFGAMARGQQGAATGAPSTPNGGATPAGLNLDPQTQLALSVVMPQASEALAKWQELARPHVSIGPSGEAYNEYDPGTVGKTFPKVGDGQVVLRDPQGNPTGIANLNGYTDAVAQTAGATEAGKAPWTLVDVPQSDGTTRKVPLSVAAPALAAGLSGGSAGAGAGGGADTGSGGAQFGVTQSPAAQTLANKRAETQANNEAIQPKELAALNGLDAASNLTSTVLHQILGDSKDPKTGQWVQTGQPLANWWTTGGVGEALSHLPGTPSYDLDQQLEHIRAMTSMDELQKLRDNSPTGAGLGRVTQQEINLLAAMRGSLDQGQRTPQFLQNVRRQLEQLDATQTNRHQLYQNQFGNVQRPTPGATAPIPPGQGGTPSRAAMMAEARRRGLIQ